MTLEEATLLEIGDIVQVPYHNCEAVVIKVYDVDWITLGDEWGSFPNTPEIYDVPEETIRTFGIVSAFAFSSDPDAESNESIEELIATWTSHKNKNGVIPIDLYYPTTK